ncbi:hypothetical protein [Amycolatopsis circi]|uniref:hypothetical protein n=1 Tax=Amycolatopsis circi TaxID=871959 RepID=UPI000E271231|nr:hypothetical protein [Amycolatopsis circi]
MSKAAVEYQKNGVVIVPPLPLFPEPHNKLDHGVCGCGLKVETLAAWEEHRKHIGRGILQSKTQHLSEPTQEEKLTRELRDRNRAYGKASATIGELRATVARLALERAQERQAVPGFVDGDLLADVLTDSAPPEWTKEAARARAEKTLTAVAAAGFRVLRGQGREPWPPTAEPGFRRFHADQLVHSNPVRKLSFEPREGMRLRRLHDGAVRTVTSVRSDPKVPYGLAVFVDEGRVTELGPIVLDAWEVAPRVPKPGGGA